MATGGTNRSVKGLGAGDMQFLAPFQLVDESGAVVFSVDSAGAVVSASSVTANSVVDGSGNVSLAADLAVGDDLTVVGDSAVAALAVSGDIAVATNKLTVAASTGNTAIAGTLAVAGAATASAAVKLAGIETGLTAHSGGGQGSALALLSTKTVHNISTVAAGNDSVGLPAATGSGALHFVKNSAAANSAQVFGAGTDTIDGVATGTGVAIAAGKSRLFIDAASGNWVSLLGA